MAMRLMNMMMKKVMKSRTTNMKLQTSLHPSGSQKRPSTRWLSRIALRLWLKMDVKLIYPYRVVDGLLPTPLRLERILLSWVSLWVLTFILANFFSASVSKMAVAGEISFDKQIGLMGDKMILLFQGSGAGADQGYSMQSIQVPGGQHASFKPVPEDIYFARAIDERRLIAVKGFGNKRQELVIIDTVSNNLEVLAWTEDAALMYPTLSRDHKQIATFILPGRRDAPPRSFAEARLGVLPMPSPGIDLKARRISAANIIADHLPVIPFDWDATSNGIFYTAVAPPHISHIDLQTRQSRTQRSGLFPRLSADGNLLALIDGQKIVVVKSTDPSSVIISRSVEGQPGWLTWKGSDKVLAYSEELPAWRVKINLLSITDNHEVTLLETARVKNLIWLGQEPNWERLKIE